MGTNAYGVNNSPEIEAVYEKGTLLYTGGKLYKNGELVEEDETIFNGKPYWGISHSTLVKKFYDEG